MRTRHGFRLSNRPLLFADCTLTGTVLVKGEWTMEGECPSNFTVVVGGELSYDDCVPEPLVGVFFGYLGSTGLQPPVVKAFYIGAGVGGYPWKRNYIAMKPVWSSNPIEVAASFAFEIEVNFPNGDSLHSRQPPARRPDSQLSNVSGWSRATENCSDKRAKQATTFQLSTYS